MKSNHTGGYIVHCKHRDVQREHTGTVWKPTLGEVVDFLYNVRESHLEYEDAVQDVATDFLEENGKSVVSVKTYRGNYADCLEEYYVTDAAGKQIAVTWQDVIRKKEVSEPPKMLDKIKEIANQQRENASESGDTDGCIGFKYRGQFIIDPWMDESGRFKLTTDEAIEKYGAGFTAFCEEVADKHHLN